MILDGDHLNMRLITACCGMTCTSLAHLAFRMAERNGTGKTRCSFLETDFRFAMRHLRMRFGVRSFSLCSIPVDSADSLQSLPLMMSSVAILYRLLPLETM